MNLSNKKQKNIVLLLIVTFTFLLYGNSIKNNYSLDDDYVTITSPERQDNLRIKKGINGISEIFSTHYIESKQQSFEYRPLVLVTFAIEYQLFGSNPHINHLINILIYALTNIILFLLLLKIFKNYTFYFPLLITCVFIAHPIHTEVVSNIKCRDELLSFLFGIISTFYLFKNRETEKKYYIILAVLSLLMALLCKKTAELFIVFAPFTLYFFSRINLKQLLYYCGFLYISVICFALLKNTLLDNTSQVRVFAFFENPLFYESSFLNRLPIAFYSVGYYIKLLMFPYPLSCYYGYSVIPIAEWTSPFVIASLFFYVFIVIFAIKNFTKKNILSYSIVIYLLGIFPFSNLFYTPSGIIAERYIYFASFGFCIAFVYFLLTIFKIDMSNNSDFKLKNIKTFFIFCFGFILIVFSGLSMSRNTKWKDEITLFRTDSKNFKNSCNLHYILGNKLYPQIFNTPNGFKRDSIINEATFHYKQAVNLMAEGVKKYPTDYTTLNNIGTIYVNIFNDANSAQPYFEKALKIKPDDIQIQYNFAFCYEKRNLKDSAILMYEKMVLQNTSHSPVYSQLRELYINKQDYLKAMSCDKKAIEKNPSSAKLHINLGNTYLLIKDTLNGINQFEKAVKLEPANTNLKTQIISFLRSAGYSKNADKLENK